MLPFSTASTKAMLVQPAASISSAAWPGLRTSSASAVCVRGRLTTSATANRISVSQMPESPCVSSSRIGYQMTPHMLAPMSRLVTGEMVKARLADTKKPLRTYNKRKLDRILTRTLQDYERRFSGEIVLGLET